MSQTISEIETISPAESLPPSRDDAASLASRQPVEEMELETSRSGSAAEDESHYPTGATFALIVFSIALVLTMSGMDSSILSVAVPALTQEWHSVRDIGWYSSAYRLCMCSFQFMFGKLYKLFSIKKIFLSSIAVFLVGSTLCATATSSEAFIIGRAVCGLSCAGIISGCFTMMRQALPLRKRAMYASIFAAIEGIADVGSPILGGVLVQSLGWRWCFWINLPMGVFTFAVTAFVLKDLRPSEDIPLKDKLRELDLPGTLLFFPAMIALFLALTWAGTRLAWDSATVIALLCVFAVLLAVFAVEQWLKQESAMLPPRILKKRSVLAGALFSLCCNGCLRVIEYYIPTYLQTVHDYSPAKSGYLLVPLIVCFLISCLIQGVGVNIVGYFVPFMLAGSILLPVSAGMMTTLTVGSGLGSFIAYSAMLGFAGGIGFQAPQVAVQNTLPEKDSHIGLAIILFAQNFGPAVFVAAAQSILTDRLSQNLGDVSPSLTPARIEKMGLSDLKDHVGAAKLHEVVFGIDKSIMQTWYLGVALACVTMVGSALMEWKYVKQKRR